MRTALMHCRGTREPSPRDPLLVVHADGLFDVLAGHCTAASSTSTSGIRPSRGNHPWSD
jgi:hypothetical protein